MFAFVKQKSYVVTSTYYLKWIQILLLKCFVWSRIIHTMESHWFSVGVDIAVRPQETLCTKQIAPHAINYTLGCLIYYETFGA